MITVSIQEASDDLSQFVEQAAKGEPVIITIDNKSVAKLVALDPPSRSKRLGFLEGQCTVPDDFDTMFQDEIIKLFEG